MIRQRGGSEGQGEWSGRVSGWLFRRPGRLSPGLLLCLVMLLGGCSRGELLEQSQAAWDSGDYAAAADLAERFLRESPQSDKVAEVRFRVAIICSRDLRDYDRAIGHLIRLIEDHPKSPDLPEARLRLAECYAAVGRSDEAISEYESLLPGVPDQREQRRLRLVIADLYYDKNDLRQAVVEYQKVTVVSPADDLSVRACLRIAQVRYLRDEFDEALPAYQVVIDHATDPELKRVAQLGRVDCLERLLQFDQAVAVLEAMPPDPKSPDYLTRRIAEIRDRQRQRNQTAPASVDWSRR